VSSLPAPTLDNVNWNNSGHRSPSSDRFLPPRAGRTSLESGFPPFLNGHILPAWDIRINWLASCELFHPLWDDINSLFHQAHNVCRPSVSEACERVNPCKGKSSESFTLQKCEALEGQATQSAWAFRLWFRIRPPCRGWLFAKSSSNSEGQDPANP